MTGAVRGKTVPLDNAAVAFADRSACHIHFLPGLEYVQTYDSTRGKITEGFWRYAKLLEHVAGLNGCLGEMPCRRLVDANGTALSESHLHGRIAIRAGSLDLCYAVIRHVKHCNRLTIAIASENASHANLTADKS
jgi:hypothetical protein